MCTSINLSCRVVHAGAVEAVKRIEQTRAELLEKLTLKGMGLRKYFWFGRKLTREEAVYRLTWPPRSIYNFFRYEYLRSPEYRLRELAMVAKVPSAGSMNVSLEDVRTIRQFCPEFGRTEVL